jgi:SAM-dependent methyltransferase
MSDTPQWTDPAVLAEQYRSAGNLAARQAIYAYQQPGRDLPDAVLELAELRGDETVVDVGCGPGSYLLRLAGHRGPVLGVDRSPGMARTAAERAPAARTAVADAAALPLPDGSVHVAIAAHMLYHLPDPAAALRELHRVTRDRVLVVLNGTDHLAELRALGAGNRDRLTLDDGERLLAAEFGSVTRHDFRGELRIPDSGPIEAYAASLPGGGRLDGLGPGPFRIGTHTGCLLASVQ